MSGVFDFVEKCLALGLSGVSVDKVSAAGASGFLAETF